MIRQTKRKGRTGHKQVEIEWGGLRAEVDKELAPLILALWKAGIVTTNSCQQNFPGIAWIEFLTTRDAKKFLNLVAVYPEQEERPFWETLYGRVTGYGSDGDWEFNLHPHNRGVDEEIVNDELIETCIGHSDFEFHVSVRFPRTDIPLILDRVQATLCPSRKRFPELEAKLLSKSVKASLNALNKPQPEYLSIRSAAELASYRTTTSGERLKVENCRLRTRGQARKEFSGLPAPTSTVGCGAEELFSHPAPTSKIKSAITYPASPLDPRNLSATRRPASTTAWLARWM